MSLTPEELRKLPINFDLAGAVLHRGELDALADELERLQKDADGFLLATHVAQDFAAKAERLQKLVEAADELCARVNDYSYRRHRGMTIIDDWNAMQKAQNEYARLRDGGKGR